MKKILVLTPRFPYPVIGGDRLRIYKICEELSKRYSLTLLSLCENNDEMSYHPDDGVFTDIIRIKQSKILSYLNVLKA
ncbi:glycosyl transferase family 1, partial [Escherichia coli]|nr:glycosyl transferase family 1 [Escherichia coli]